MKVLQKENLLLELMKNFIEVISEVDAIMIYNRQGLLISKYTLSELLDDGLEESEREEIYGAFLSSIEPMSRKISKDYRIGELGLITFKQKIIV